MEYQLKLKKKEFLTDDVILSDFEVVSGGPLEFLSGQFLVSKFPAADGDVFRSYSIFSPQHKKDVIRYLFRYIAGPGTTFLKDMKLGDEITVKGPVGNFQLKEPQKTEVFIATGTGIAPIHSMVETRLAQKSHPEIYLVFGSRTQDDLFLEDIFKSWESSVNIFRTLSRADSSWKGLRGYVTAHLDQFPVEDVTYYICGSKSMIDDVRIALEKKGVVKDSILFERFY